MAVFVVTYRMGDRRRTATELEASAEGPAALAAVGSAPAGKTPREPVDGGGTPGGRPEREAAATPAARAAYPIANATFAICHTGGGVNCVVDGDTAWIGGVKVRIADIDAPETHPPRCASEADLGRRATERLADLMNAGPFELGAADRDADRYGRKLRILVRSDTSLGEQLVREGLARRWEGHRRPWC